MHKHMVYEYYRPGGSAHPSNTSYCGKNSNYSYGPPRPRVPRPPVLPAYLRQQRQQLHPFQQQDEKPRFSTSSSSRDRTISGSTKCSDECDTEQTEGKSPHDVLEAALSSPPAATSSGDERVDDQHPVVDARPPTTSPEDLLLEKAKYYQFPSAWKEIIMARFASADHCSKQGLAERAEMERWWHFLDEFDAWWFGSGWIHHHDHGDASWCASCEGEEEDEQELEQVGSCAQHYDEKYNNCQRSLQSTAAPAAAGGGSGTSSAITATVKTTTSSSFASVERKKQGYYYQQAESGSTANSNYTAAEDSKAEVVVVQPHNYGGREEVEPDAGGEGADNAAPECPSSEGVGATGDPFSSPADASSAEAAIIKAQDVIDDLDALKNNGGAEDADYTTEMVAHQLEEPARDHEPRDAAATINPRDQVLRHEESVEDWPPAAGAAPPPPGPVAKRGRVFYKPGLGHEREVFLQRDTHTGEVIREIVVSKKFLATVKIGISPGHRFGPAKRIIGPQGHNMKLISSQVAGAKLRLKGSDCHQDADQSLVSYGGGGGRVGHNFQGEAGTGEQTRPLPLQLFISCQGPENYVRVKALTMRLLALVYEDFEQETGESAAPVWKDHPLNPWIPDIDAEMRKIDVDSVPFILKFNGTNPNFHRGSSSSSVLVGGGGGAGGPSITSTAVNEYEKNPHQYSLESKYFPTSSLKNATKKRSSSREVNGREDKEMKMNPTFSAAAYYSERCKNRSSRIAAATGGEAVAGDDDAVAARMHEEQVGRHRTSWEDEHVPVGIDQRSFPIVPRGRYSGQQGSLHRAAQFYAVAAKTAQAAAAKRYFKQSSARGGGAGRGHLAWWPEEGYQWPSSSGCNGAAVEEAGPDRRGTRATGGDVGDSAGSRNSHSCAGGGRGAGTSAGGEHRNDSWIGWSAAALSAATTLSTERAVPSSWSGAAVQLKKGSLHSV
eukprot:CAMPEP_0178991186 /NCGR_PEP_ID=MMETSP0795-20121207/5379_1 /TAXON_ID=88552 /ORGANISM="Amoebophrya sp., Strain Ameob2" /LENGTH=948 /DNA_ID=CAMNT_0020682849 /DNA_START=175 /DNA_END=3021 /DNA_ORIENTATION=-